MPELHVSQVRSTLIRPSCPLALIVLLATGTWAQAAPPPDRQQELLQLLRHDCGSCHGLTLKGGLGPPLKPENLKQWSLDALTGTILQGRPGTPMPPWRPLLSDEDATWLAQRLQEGVE